MRRCRYLPLHASAALLALLIQVSSLHGYSSNSNRQKPFTNIQAKAASNEKPKEDALFGLFSLMPFPSRQRRRQQQTSNTQQPPPQRPPLVDSDLLRFLSLQKQNLKRQQCPSNSSVTVVAESIADARGATLEEEEIIGGSLGLASATTAETDSLSSLVSFSSSSPSSSSSSSSSFWLSQYNSHRVAQLLLSKDPTLDESLASLAGERVQAQVLSRTARRRVRQFLKERDRVWGGMAARQQQQQQQQTQQLQTQTSQQEVPALQSTSSPSTEAAAAAAASSTNSSSLFVTYGIQDTVELLLDTRYGLTVRDIAEILIHTPSVALMQPKPSSSISTSTIAAGGVAVTAATARGGGETLQETLDRALVRLLCGTLGLRKYDSRKVLRSCPGLLTKRGSRSAEQTVNLLSKLNVSTNSLARDKAALPILLSRSPSLIFRLVSFLSSDAVRMPVSQIGPLLRRPQSLELLDAVAPVVPLVSKSSSSMLSSALASGVPGDNDGDDLESSSPSMGESLLLLTYDTDGVDDDDHPGVMAALWGRSSQDRRDRINQVYRNMTVTAWTLRHEVGTINLGKVIAAYPTVLLLNAQDQILAVANYLMHGLGIWKDDLARVLQLYPVLLGMNVSQMEEVVSYLMDELDIDSDSLAVIFRSFPYLLTLSVEQDMEPVVQFLQSQIGIANVGRFISRLPPVLGYSVERDLEPKWKFLETSFVDARFEVTRFPAYFSYPLERVIKTRFKYLRDVKHIPTPLVALDQVLRYGDKDFATKVAKDTDNGAAFASFVKQRGRKSSELPKSSSSSSKSSRRPVSNNLRAAKRQMAQAKKDD